MKLDFDCTIVGAGVVGLAIASVLSRKKISILVLEKNNSFGEHNSSRNSGVIHAGIYYPENSLKAKLCKIGNKMIYKYAKERGVNVLNCGKLIISKNINEEKKLISLKKNAKKIGVELDLLDKKEVQRLESNVLCYSALLSKSTGIIDSHQLMTNFTADVENHGGKIVYNHEVNFIEENKSRVNFKIKDLPNIFSTKILINSAGLYSHDLAKKIKGFKKNLIPKINLIKGNYFKLLGQSPFKRLIYPLPSKDGLGIHSTINFDNETIFGPDTQKIRKIDFSTPKNLKNKFINSIFSYWPEIKKRNISIDYCGIRTSLDNKDFLIQGYEVHKMQNIINLFGIESPGLTSSLAIGKYIYEKYF